MTDFDLLKDADGLYPEDISDIIANADPEKRKILTKVGKAVVRHAKYDRCWRWLEGTLQESNVGMEATSGLLYGPPGVGKSTVLKKFVRKFGGPFATASGDVRPVVRVSIPSDPNLGNILSAILAALGAHELIIGDNTDKKVAVNRQLELQKVKMIIFDEFNNLVEDKTEKFTKKTARELKEMLSEGRCQLIFSGTPEIVDLHNIYSQFRRRSAGDFILTPLDWKDDLDREQWIAIMETLQQTMLLKPAVPLDDAELAYKVNTASNGIMDHAMKLLFRATSLAYDYDEKQIEVDVLAEAFEWLRRGDNKTPNPFGLPRSRAAKPTLVEDEDEEFSGLFHQSAGPAETFTK